MQNRIELTYTFKAIGFPTYGKTVTQEENVGETFEDNGIIFDLIQTAADGSTVKFEGTFQDTTTIGNDEYQSLHNTLLENDWKLL